jgi:hypothetical protein
MFKVITVGLDIAKSVFQAAGFFQLRAGGSGSGASYRPPDWNDLAVNTVCGQWRLCSDVRRAPLGGPRFG